VPTALNPHRVTLLGSGTCRIDPHRGQTAACVIVGEITYVIDLGASALERLEAHGAFENCRELHIHISHRHIDHVFGLFPLLHCLTWSDDARHLGIKRVVINATQSVCEAIRSTQAIWGDSQTQLVSDYPGCTDRLIEYRPGPDAADWRYQVGPITVDSIHLPTHYNHGVRFSLGGKTYAFTCDATELGTHLTSFCAGVDLCVFDLGHLSFTPTEDRRFELNLEYAAQFLASANPKVAYAAHIYLRHLQYRPLSPADRTQENVRIIEQLKLTAQRLGFCGTLLVAEAGISLH
jgi:phosphoribosyl 1,2-cyclic phosphodiesterase